MPRQSKTDWDRLKRMTEEEIEANALADFDSQPTDESFWSEAEIRRPAKKVSRFIFGRIYGIPYSRSKTRGKTYAPEEWTQQIIDQTKDLPKISEACILKVTFLLPPDKFPKDLPYGPDLDNLLKRFGDALTKTIFSDAEGKDSCVLSVTAMKTKVDSEAEAGAIIEVLPVSIEK